MPIFQSLNYQVKKAWKFSTYKRELSFTRKKKRKKRKKGKKRKKEKKEKRKKGKKKKKKEKKVRKIFNQTKKRILFKRN